MATGVTQLTLVLIGSDGKRACISCAIATEASFLLRDLLDGQCIQPSHDLKMERQRNDDQSLLDGTQDMVKHTATTDTNPNRIPDLLDFFPPAPHADDTAISATSPKSYESPWDVPVDQPAVPHSAAAEPQKVTMPEVTSTIELQFPYFSGDILQRVCEHMSYRYRVSTFVADDGHCRVYPCKMREIPRPMTLPLSEYLDARDRKFVDDWDDLTTVLMVKAATLLNYDELLQLASAKLASLLCEKSVEGIRSLLGVESDFTPAEEAELRKESAS